MKRILITGCLKSGMAYTAGLLTTAGVRVGYKKMGPDGNVDWRRAYSDNEEYDVVLHQVREPLADISSSLEMGAWAWNFVCEKEPRISLGDPVLLRSMKYWLYWNQRAQTESLWTYRLESLPKVLDKILEAAGAEGSHGVSEEIEERSRDFHERRLERESEDTLTFDDLLREDRVIGESVAFTGKSYGYKEKT